MNVGALFKTSLLVFILSFLLNLIWENLHSLLYVHYKGGEITEAILFHATFVDAVIITSLGVFFGYISFLRERLWLVCIPAVLIAVAIETWALGTGRWAYGPLMPIIPLIGTGLTPTIQLALTGYLTFLFAFKRR